jgi:hypothetical protein
VLKGLVCAGFFVGLAFGQGTTKPAAHVRVEVIPARKNFVEGEKPKFYLFLLNEGPSVVSVSKHWSFAGGGMSGFYVSVNQLSGKRPASGCGLTAADVFRLEDPRSAEQLKKEEYVELSPEMTVGTEYEVTYCDAIPNAGTFEITASFVTGDSYLHKISTLDTPDNHVLQGEFKATPLRFEVLPKSKKKARTAGRD